MTTPTTLPDRFEIPESLVADWLAIPPGQEIEARFTRRLVEHLFFSIDKLQRSQDHLQACMIYLSSQNTDDANKTLVESQRASIEAANRLRQFLMEIMLDATRTKT